MAMQKYSLAHRINNFRGGMNDSAASLETET